MFFPGAHSSIPTLPAVLLAAPQNWNQNWLKKPARPKPGLAKPEKPEKVGLTYLKINADTSVDIMNIRFC